MKTNILTHKDRAAQGHGHFEIISLDQGQEVWRSPVMNNRLLDAGLANIIANHAGNDTTPLEITSLEIGTGNTAVDAEDENLDTPVTTGVPPARVSTSGKQLVIEFFIVDANLPDDTYTEIGLRTDDILITRALFENPYTKVSGRDTIIRYTISYSAV